MPFYHKNNISNTNKNPRSRAASHIAIPRENQIIETATCSEVVINPCMPGDLLAEFHLEA